MKLPDTIVIDPSRLASGEWCHRLQKTVGEGDIHASYSADRIGIGRPVRKPFIWKGCLLVCVSSRYKKDEGVLLEAYRLVSPMAFEGEATTYGDKTSDADAARADPNGFYHGIRVKHASAAFVLCGPPVSFVPSETEQFTLF